MNLIDPEQTLDIYVDNLMRHAFKCYAQSERSGERTSEPELSPLQMGPLSPESGATTTPIGDRTSQPPFGGSDEESEYIERDWEDAAAFDAGVRRFGEI